MRQNEAIHEIVKPLGELVGIVGMHQGRNLLEQLALVALGKEVERLRPLIFFHILPAHFYGNQVGVQRRHLLVAGFGQLGPPGLFSFCGMGAFLQGHSNPHLFTEDVLGQGFGFPGLIALLVGTEKFKIAAVVKDQETALVRVGSVDLVHTGKALAQAGTPADHLPEFRLGAHLLEKY